VKRKSGTLTAKAMKKPRKSQSEADSLVDADYDPIAWLGRTIRRRTKKTAAEANVQPAP